MIQIWKNKMVICKQLRKKDWKQQRLSNKKVEPEQNRFTSFTLSAEVNHNRQDAGGTIDSKSRASTKGKEPNVICE